MWQFVKRFMGRRDPRVTVGRPTDRRPQYPASFTLTSHPQPPPLEHLVFDPALMHFTHGVRVPDPSSLSADEQGAWSKARRDAMDHLLRLVLALPAAKGLVLRGSMAMCAWYGSQARVPRDIDWVVRPADIPPDGPWSEELFTGLLTSIAERPQAGNVAFDPRGAVCDDIWTYERAEGRRLAVPWRTAQGWCGSTLMDVVFREPLPEEPVSCVIPGGDGQDITAMCASRTTSLAWKLLWLATDINPQGKDLYDAALLAESTTLPLGLVAKVFAAADSSPVDPRRPTTCTVDWANFLKEYPLVVGTSADWQHRLATALAAMPGWDMTAPAPESTR